MIYGSLFAGIGGIDLGLDRAGMECAWQVEIDPYCRRVLAKHWPDVPRLEDVTECGARNLSRVDLIAGGFPCQDISIAGKGEGIDGERSGLWSEFHRIICELRPRIVIVENVPALLARGIDRVLGDLAESGYDSEWDCIPAAAVGAPHRRDRVFIVAYTAGRRGPDNEIQARRDASRRGGQDLGDTAGKRIDAGDGRSGEKGSGSPASAGPLYFNDSNCIGILANPERQRRSEGESESSQPGRDADTGKPGSKMADSEGEPQRAGLC